MQYYNNNNPEINKFDELAYSWWDTNGPLKTLHHINVTRMDFIHKIVNASHRQLSNSLVLDLGCGGGILSESLATVGAIVTGVDLAHKAIEIAKLHLYESKLNINYICNSVSNLLLDSSNHNKFDIITNMEMLEHVDDPEEIIAACASLLKPNGILFLSTINRNIKSYLLAILFAEYVLNLVPRGTHDYQKLLKPEYVRTLLHRYGLRIIKINGIAYNPFNNQSKLSNNIDINYILACIKE